MQHKTSNRTKNKKVFSPSTNKGLVEFIDESGFQIITLAWIVYGALVQGYNDRGWCPMSEKGGLRKWKMIDLPS